MKKIVPFFPSCLADTVESDTAHHKAQACGTHGADGSNLENRIACMQAWYNRSASSESRETRRDGNT